MTRHAILIASLVIVAFSAARVRAADKPADKARAASETTQTIALENHYLLLPVKNGAKRSHVRLEINGGPVREFDIELADGDPDFWAFLDISRFKGKTAKLILRGGSESAQKAVTQGDTVPGQENFYKEKLRPQFHFSQKIGWNNDPNGMVYYEGEWHLFFQHNPYGWRWGNMHWGHAVSKDLVHWEQLPIAIYNHRYGDWVFSGSAAVDWNNTGGFQTGSDKVIVAAYTSTGRGESIAYSNDRGRTFTDYEGNPVVKHSGRDPNICWYEPTKTWVMAVFDQDREHGRGIAFYNSPDLKHWELKSKLPGYYECPELIQLPVDGDKNNTRWVVFAADAQYAVGRFDGEKFTPEHEGKHRVHYGRYYASQTFTDAPNNRRIQIGWARITMEGMPFNQMMTFPHELTLHTTNEGIRMFAAPIKEIELLHKAKQEIHDKLLKEGQTATVSTAGDLFDIRAEFNVEKSTAREIGLSIDGRKIVFDLTRNNIMGATVKPTAGKVSLQILVDRPSIEVCVGGGQAYITDAFRGDGNIERIEAFSTGGDATLDRLVVYPLKSIWND